MSGKQIKVISIRYAIATVGLFLVAVGIALSILSNLGTSPLSCPSYVVNGIWGLTVGNWTIIINMSYILIQALILGRGFKAKYLMQIPASLVFGYLIDFSLWIFSWVHPVAFAGRLFLILISCLVTALGVSIEVVAQAWMLSAEMTVYAVVKVSHFEFGPVKVVMDTIMVVISAVLAALMFGNPFGYGEYSGIVGIITGTTPGVVIGLGTLLMALLTGSFMKFTDPVVDKMMDKVIDRIMFGNV